MNIPEKIKSLLPELDINKKLSDESLPVAPERKEKDFGQSPALPEGWGLELNGRTWVEYSVLDPGDPLTHAAYSIFQPNTPLSESDDGSVITRNARTAWVRLGMGAEGGAGLSVKFSPVAVDGNAFAQGEVALYIPGDHHAMFGTVVHEFAGRYFQPGPFEPVNALPPGGGFEIAFQSKVSMGVSVDFSDLLASGVNRLAGAGASVVGFEPVASTAKLQFKATAEGGFLLQIGRQPDNADGDSVYRFRLATRSGVSRSYGMRVTVEGNLDGSPMLADFEKALGDLVGVTDLVPILAGEKGSKDQVENALAKLGIPKADRTAAKVADLVKSLREDLASHLKQDLEVRIHAQLTRSTSTETLYQWRSEIPPGGTWDAGLRAALLRLDIDEIHRIVTDSPGRCFAEIYRTRRIDREGYDLGIDFSLGRWTVGGRSTREFVFQKSRDQLAQTEAYAFDMGRGRLLGRLTEVDFWKAGLEARPLQKDDADTYDELEYSFDFLWQSDKGDDGVKILGRQAVGEAVDLLYAVRPELSKVRLQTELLDAVGDALEDAGWLGKEGFAVVEIGTKPLPASECMERFKKIARRRPASAAMARLASRAFGWKDEAHRESVAVREEVFEEFFQSLFKQPTSVRAAKNILEGIAEDRILGSEISRALGKELARNLPTPMPIRKRPRKNTEKYALGHPFNLADDFRDVLIAFGKTLAGFRTLSKSIEEKTKISKEGAKELEKDLFRLARFGAPFEYRLFLLLVAEQLPLETLTVVFHSVESDQSWPIFIADR